MRHAFAGLAVALLPLLPANAGDPPPPKVPNCTIKADPDDRVAQGQDLVVPAGAVVKDAVAVRGSVIIRRGARVRKAVSVGGAVTVQAGAEVIDQVVALGGDVVVEANARVGGEAVSLGGQVRLAPGGTISGNVVSLSLQVGDGSLARAVLDGIHAQGPCLVERE
jgi:tetrahydrodipicolinate N-succinyltransferase